MVFAVYTDDKVKSLKTARAACEAREYKDSICLELLAYFLAQNGDFKGAVKWETRALEIGIFGEQFARERLASYKKEKLPESMGVYWFFVK